MNLPFIDLLVFLVYMTGIVLFGCSFFLKNRSSDQYTSGGGKMPSWAVGMSILATLISSITFLAYPGEGFSSNWILLV